MEVHFLPKNIDSPWATPNHTSWHFALSYFNPHALCLVPTYLFEMPYFWEHQFYFMHNRVMTFLANDGDKENNY